MFYPVYYALIDWHKLKNNEKMNNLIWSQMCKGNATNQSVFITHSLSLVISLIMTLMMIRKMRRWQLRTRRTWG